MEEREKSENSETSRSGEKSEKSENSQTSTSGAKSGGS